MTKPILAAATMILVEEGRLALDESVDRLAPELANRRVLKRIDGPLDETVAANRPITIEDLLTFRMGYGLVFEPTFDPPYPINNAANELQLVMGPPDPRTPHNPDEWMRCFRPGSWSCRRSRHRASGSGRRSFRPARRACSRLSTTTWGSLAFCATRTFTRAGGSCRSNQSD